MDTLVKSYLNFKLFFEKHRALSTSSMNDISESYSKQQLEAYQCSLGIDPPVECIEKSPEESEPPVEEQRDDVPEEKKEYIIPDEIKACGKFRKLLIFYHRQLLFPM